MQPQPQDRGYSRPQTLEPRINPVRNDDHLRWAIAIALMAAFWLTLARLDYPRPHGTDDLIFIGPAIGLMQFHELRNPYLQEYNRIVPYLSAKFYQFPPFHAYTLLAWIKTFGVSAASLLFFQACCNLAFSVFFGLSLRNFGYGIVCALGAVPLYAFYMTPCGLRPENLANACVAAGVWVLSRRDFKGGVFGGALLFSLAVMVHPALVFFGACLGAGLCLLVFRTRPGPPGAKASSIIIQTALAGAFVAGLFLLSIHGDLAGFLTDFRHHARIAGVAPGVSPGLKAILAMLTARSNKFTNLPIALFSCVMVVQGVWMRRKSFRPTVMAAALAAATYCFLFLVVAETYRIWPAFFVLSAMGWAAAISCVDAGKRHFLAYVFVLLFGLQVLPKAIIWFSESKPDLAHLGEIRTEVLSHTNAVVLLDDAASRYVFDYKYHPGFLSWSMTSWSPYLGDELPSETLKRAPLVLIITPAPDPPATLFGRTFTHLKAPQYRFEIVTNAP